MKTLIALTIMLFSSQSLGHHLTGHIFRTVVPAEHTYIPKGYDSNDNVELIVEGYLPNLCYKSPHTSVKVEGSTININLMAWTNDDGTVMCAEMVVPFIQTVSLGVLDKGHYNVIVNQEIHSQLFVDESTSDAMDDLIYANVEVIERDPYSNRVVFKGHNPSHCFEFDRFENISNDKDVLSVLPIMKQVTDLCPRKMVPFELEYEVPQILNRDRFLINVRTMNGKSVNQLFQR